MKRQEVKKSKRPTGQNPGRQANPRRWGRGRSSIVNDDAFITLVLEVAAEYGRIPGVPPSLDGTSAAIVNFLASARSQARSGNASGARESVVKLAACAFRLAQSLAC